MSEPYESPIAWDRQRPEAVILSCVDGRWRQHFQNFAIQRLGAGPNSDFMAVPGGIEPLTLSDRVPKDFSFFRRRLEALVEDHGTRRIVAIAHQDCAWYRARKRGPLQSDPRGRQLDDLRRAGAILQQMFPGVGVETYYARLSQTEPPRVLFEAV
jgi:hypothetical protein